MTDYHKPESPDGLQWQQLGRQKRSYLMQDFCRIGLPIRNPGPDTAKWVRTNGNLTYVLHPHTIKRDDGGVTHIWPYGKKARLLLVWISTQVVRQKDYNTDRVIMLPSTLRGLMADLGMRRKPRPADYDDFSHQISALSNFSMTITRTGTPPDKALEGGQDVALIEESHIGWSRYTPKDAATEGSYIKLTQETWDRMAKSTPLSSEIVELLTSDGKGFDFDIYAWLSQRIYALNHSRYYQTPVIPWTTLQRQMGSNCAETRNFVTYFKRGIRHVAALWDATLVDAGKDGRLRYSFEKGGLRLYKSSLSVVPKKRGQEPRPSPARARQEQQNYPVQAPEAWDWTRFQPPSSHDWADTGAFTPPPVPAMATMSPPGANWFGLPKSPL